MSEQSIRDELVEEARRFDRAKITHDLADALTAVSAERDRLHKAIAEALATAPKLGELRWRNVDRMIGILRAALDKEGNDDE